MNHFYFTDHMEFSLFGLADRKLRAKFVAQIWQNSCKLLTEFYYPAAKFCFVLISFSIQFFTMLDFGFLYLGIIDIMDFVSLFCGDVPSSLLGV